MAIAILLSFFLFPCFSRELHSSFTRSLEELYVTRMNSQSTLPLLLAPLQFSLHSSQLLPPMRVSLCGLLVRAWS